MEIVSSRSCSQSGTTLPPVADTRRLPGIDVVLPREQPGRAQSSRSASPKEALESPISADSLARTPLRCEKVCCSLFRGPKDWRPGRVLAEIRGTRLLTTLMVWYGEALVAYIDDES